MIKISSLACAMAAALAVTAPCAAKSVRPHPVKGACGTIPSGAAPFDFAAREKQVASGEQRVAPLDPKDFTPEALAISDSLQAFFGSKEEGIPKSFRTMFKHPGLYRGQMALGLELNQNGKLPPRAVSYTHLTLPTNREV